MYRIIEISNAHMWDGKLLTTEQWSALINVLRISKFLHTIRYIAPDGEQWTSVI